MSDPAAAELNRLRWRCRRGMRELDVLLERFLRRDWPGAAPDRRAAFLTLLELPDPELADLLLGRVAAADSVLSAIVSDIMECPDGELSAAAPVYSGDFGRARRPGQDQ